MVTLENYSIPTNLKSSIGKYIPFWREEINQYRISVRAKRSISYNWRVRTAREGVL